MPATLHHAHVWIYLKEFLFSVISTQAGEIIIGEAEALPTLSSHVGEERLSLAESRTYLNMSKESGLLLSLRK